MFTVRKIADTWPSTACGVTVWRSVVEAIDQMIGPAPNRKNEAAASAPCGHHSVAAIVNDAATDTNGPSRIEPPNGSAPITRDASIAPVTMPAP